MSFNYALRNCQKNLYIEIHGWPSGQLGIHYVAVRLRPWSHFILLFVLLLKQDFVVKLTTVSSGHDGVWSLKKKFGTWIY